MPNEQKLQVGSKLYRFQIYLWTLIFTLRVYLQVQFYICWVHEQRAQERSLIPVMMILNLCHFTHTSYKTILQTTATSCKKSLSPRGEILHQTRLFYLLQPFSWEGTTPSAQQFLLLDTETTQEKPIVFPPNSWGISTPANGRGRTAISAPKISSSLIILTRITILIRISP